MPELFTMLAAFEKQNPDSVASTLCDRLGQHSESAAISQDEVDCSNVSIITLISK